jgi:hypothetical protein
MTTTTELKKQFLHSLKRGTGQAYLIVKENPAIDFSNQIIKGVLNNYAYDGQSEDNRAQYIFDILSICNQKEKIRNSVLHGLSSEQKNTWNLTHLFALTKLFAEQGDNESKQAIYDRFLHNPIEFSDWVGFSEILELDGLNGLFYIAEKFGKLIVQNPGDIQDDWIIQYFQDNNKNMNVYFELEEKSKTNKFIRKYLNNVKQTKAIHEKHKTKPTNYKDIIDEVLNTKPFFSFRRKRNLTKEEIHQVAKRLIEETDTSNIEKLLGIFDFCKFPFDGQLILDLANIKAKNKKGIVENAIKALKHLKSSEIRNFAIENIQNSKNPIDFLAILVSNYEVGDFSILCEIANKTSNEHKIEQLAVIYIEIYKAD